MIRPPLIRGVCGLLGLLMVLPAPSLLAQRSRYDVPVPIAEARRDADGDFVPDRLGDTLTVAGYATVGTGILHGRRLQLFVQDASAGIAVFDEAMPQPVRQGDSLVVIGVLEMDRGLTVLRPLYYHARPARGTPPAPLALSLDEAGEAHEGRLVQVTGRVLVSDRTRSGGQYLTLMPVDGGPARLQVYLEPAHETGLDLRHYAAGDVYRMTGILGQFDLEPPYDTGYQLLPRAPGDIIRDGLPGHLQRRLVYVGLCVLILALAGMVLLRGQVIRRTRELAETDRRFRTIYEGVLDIILVVDDDRRILNANPEACRALGYPEATLQRLRLDDLVEDGAVEPLFPSTTGVTDHRFETCLRTRDDRSLHVAGRVNRIHFAGPARRRPAHAAQWLFVLHDITRHKEQEAELIAAKERAEELNRLKSTFLANVSHEVRTPMNGIIGIASLLEKTPLTPEQREYMQIIQHSGNALLAILNDILDFSKIEANQITLEHRPFAVRACVEEAIDMVALRASRKGLRLAYIFSPGVPPAVTGDVTRLRQVLVNLLSNAVKFTEEGEVTVYVTVAEEAADGWRLRFAVRDTGIGMPGDRLDRLFQPFSQIDASTTRKYGGTGLGLAISRRLCELMGGTMAVESRVGVGTTFTFTVQVGRPPVAPGDARCADLAGRHVLVVHPSATFRESLTRQLEDLGLTVEAVATPAVLDRREAGRAFDVALVDAVPAPGASSPSSPARLLRERLPGIPVITLFPFGGEAAAPGGGLRLHKPVKLARLREVLRQALFPETAREARPGTPEPDLPARPHAPLRVLLAEDNPINQRIALQMLSKLGHRADLAENGLEALDALARQPYDVVLLDVQMPEMDGLEAARQIRARYGERAPCLVALTAHALEDQQAECMAAGMQHYLSKPVRLETLQHLLDRIAREHAVARRRPASGSTTPT
ncbi:response regulator [Rhodocaloribacter litoris]|uniref:hybrid sensor histidine kinase/response regulator n=1 Tax=Rhodocaloribacter litoris TaxID=2558931 RepID=UPI001E4C0BC2|nr:ATP-binding protein [Rhodocaloribacter litoris]QXD16404.1 response regulator [Rhodocaloribacter litoris]